MRNRIGLRDSAIAHRPADRAGPGQVRVANDQMRPSGVAPDAAHIESWGIAGDRRWGLVDDTGQKITAREVHGLLRFRAEVVGEQAIRISNRDGVSILATAPLGRDLVPVSHSRQGYARLAAAGVNNGLTVRIGNLQFRPTMVCDRCVTTTIDPITLVGGKEPIRTLARHRRWDRTTWFGTRLVPLGTGTISVGDAIEPESPPG